MELAPFPIAPILFVGCSVRCVEVASGSSVCSALCFLTVRLNKAAVICAKLVAKPLFTHPQSVIPFSCAFHPSFPPFVWVSGANFLCPSFKWKVATFAAQSITHEHIADALSLCSGIVFVNCQVIVEAVLVLPSRATSPTFCHFLTHWTRLSHLWPFVGVVIRSVVSEPPNRNSFKAK